MSGVGGENHFCHHLNMHSEAKIPKDLCQSEKDNLWGLMFSCEPP